MLRYPSVRFMVPLSGSENALYESPDTYMTLIKVVVVVMMMMVMMIMMMMMMTTEAITMEIMVTLLSLDTD